MKITFLQKDVGGVLKHTMVDLPSDGDRWSTAAPTIRLLDSVGGVMQSSVSTDVGPSMTISAALAASQKTIGLSTTSGLQRWNEYVIGPNASGQWEWVTVDSVATSSVTVVDDLEYAYSTGHAFKSHDLSYTVVSSIVGSIARDCYAEWTYTVDTIARKDHTTFHVSRYAPRLSLTSSEVLQEYPRAIRVIGSNQRIDLLLRRLWHSRVLPDISRLFRPGAMVSGEAAESALIAKFKEVVETEAKNFDAADRYIDEYAASLDKVRESLIDLDESGGRGDDEIPRGIRTPRLTRG